MRLDVETMRRLRDQVCAAADVDSALAAFHRLVTEPLGALSVWLLRPGTDGMFRAEAVVGGEVPDGPVGDPRRLTHVFDKQQSAAISDVRPNPRWQFPAGRHDDHRAVFLTPLVSHRRSLAVLAVYWAAAPPRTAGFWVEAATPLLAAQVAEVTDFGGETERVLVVEDDAQTSRLLDLALSAEGMAVYGVSTIAEARVVADQWKPDVVVVNMLLPDGSGYELATELRSPAGPKFLFLSGLDDEDLALAEGDAYVQKPFNPSDLVQVVDALLQGGRPSRRDSTGAEGLLERYALELAISNVEERAARASLEDSYVHTVQLLADAVEARDKTTGLHIRNVRVVGLALAGMIAPELLRDRSIEYGFILHDVGKIGIPDAILLKPGKLTPDEMEVMRSHVTIGEHLVAGEPYLVEASSIVACHHERWDGGGYPRGLKGEEIPLPARIFSIADTFDAMTAERPYRKGVPPVEAQDEIGRMGGTQFDPDVTEAFLTLDLSKLDFSALD